MSDRIPVPVPTSDSRREQIERRVFEQLAALRIAERSDAAVPAAPRFAWRWALGGGLALAGVAIVVALAVGRGDATTETASVPSLVQTPAGGSSRFTVDDAIIDAGSDTSVAVQRDGQGGVTLTLARGSVDCAVEPRHGRPFLVIAGDVTVAVVGTRFGVSRTTSGVRVDVTRGKVRVTSASGERFVAAGESWASGGVAIAPPPEPPPVVAPVVPPAPPPTTEHAPSPEAAFNAAQRLEARDPAAAMRAYRAVANGKDRYAALALYSVAELAIARHDATAALAALDEYGRRFARGANAEDVAWLRVEALRTGDRQREAGIAAAAYLRAYPGGTYVKAAERIADQRR